MTDRELFEKALEALIWTTGSDDFGDGGKAREGALKLLFPSIAALRERLAQPEPVAWVTGWHDGHCVIRAVDAAVILPIGTAFYTAPPPQRQWVGLTDDEMHECWDSPLTPLGMKHARMIETKLREKNA